MEASSIGREGAKAGGPILVSGASNRTSLYTYALRVWEAFEGAATLLHLGMQSSPVHVHEPTDHIDLSGSALGIPALDAVCNNLIPMTAFRGYRTAIERALRAGLPVHYTSIDVPPLRPSRQSIVTIHDDPRAMFSPALYGNSVRYRAALWYRMLMYRKFEHIIVTSNHVKNRLIEYGVEGSIEVIYPCTPPALVPMPRESLRSGLGLPEQKTLVLSISDAQPRKNLRVVKELITRLDSSMAVVRVGPPLGGAINLGRLSFDSLARVFNACDILLQPSLEEGFGSPVAEAFAVGLPVVASDIDVMREVSGGAAMLVDPRDPDGILRAIRTMLENHETYREQSLRRGRDFAPERFYDQIRHYFARVSAG